MDNPDVTQMFSLRGETALITGGATGLGLGMARCFVAAGARVVLTGRTADALEEAVGSLGAQASHVVHDVTDTARAEEVVQTAARQAGSPVSILVNNAGIHVKKPAEQTTPEDFERILATHVVGAHALTRAVLPAMRERKRGSILFISSMAALFGIPQVIAYSAAKTAMLGMVRTLATEVSADGVRVNAIAPGWIDSQLMRKALASDPARADRILSRTPMRQFGEAADIGWAAVYLCSPAARFVTGITLPVDGGAHIGF